MMKRQHWQAHRQPKFIPHAFQDGDRTRRAHARSITRKLQREAVGRGVLPDPGPCEEDPVEVTL